MTTVERKAAVDRLTAMGRKRKFGWAVLKVLEQSTGDDPKLHRWNFTRKEHGRMVYAPLASPAS